VQEHLALLQRSPARAESWTALYRLHSAAGARDRAFVAAGVLAWLGAPSPGAEAEALLAEGANRGLPTVPVLAESDWALLRHPSVQEPLAELLAAAVPAVASVLCPRLPAPLQPIRPDDPVRETAGELATALGVDAWDLHPGPAGRVTAVAGEVPVVQIGLDLTRRASPLDTRFLIGRAVAMIRLQAHLGETLKGGALGSAVAAVVRLVVPGYSATGQPSEETVRRLGKAVGRRSRRALEAAGRALAALEAPPSVDGWLGAAGLTADRAGAVLCGDVPTALSIVMGGHALTAAGGTAVDRQSAALERPEVASLLAFAATEEHFLLRKRLRVALS
jgi:hypothetical protein